MSDINNFEQQLKSFNPHAPAIDRDELLYRSGYEAAVVATREAVCSSIYANQARPKKWTLRLAVAASVLTALFLGAIVGQEIGGARERGKHVLAKTQLKQWAGTTAIKEAKPSFDNNQNNTIVDNYESNYIELRNRILSMGVIVLPAYEMSTSPEQPLAYHQALTPFSYSAFDETPSRNKSN